MVQFFMPHSVYLHLHYVTLLVFRVRCTQHLNVVQYTQDIVGMSRRSQYVDADRAALEWYVFYTDGFLRGPINCQNRIVIFKSSALSVFAPDIVNASTCV